MPKFDNALQLAGWIWTLPPFEKLVMDGEVAKEIATEIDAYAARVVSEAVDVANALRPVGDDAKEEGAPTVYAILCGDGRLRIHGMIGAVFVHDFDAEWRLKACDDFECGRHRVAEMTPGGSLGAILEETVAWGCETFPDATPASCAAHLLKEAEELKRSPCDAGEVADVMMLLAHLCHHAGIDLATAAREKLAIVRVRKWGVADADGVIEHVR